MQTLPVERGVGMDQVGMRAAQGRLGAGEWVHIFPEGTRSKDGKMGPIRRGIGHLASSCDTPPLGDTPPGPSPPPFFAKGTPCPSLRLPRRCLQ